MALRPALTPRSPPSIRPPFPTRPPTSDHAYVTEYQNHCPMTYSTWSTQTQIRHATSPNLDGPWTPLDVAVPDAAGNPVVAVAPDGTILLYFTNTRWTGGTRNCSGASPGRPPISGPDT